GCWAFRLRVSRTGLNGYHIENSDGVAICFDPENHRVELRHPKSAAVFPVHFDLSVRSPIGDHPKLTGRVVGAMPEIATGGAKENLVIVGNAFRKKHVLKCLKRRSGEGIDADDFVLRRDWLRQQKSH